MHNGKLSIDLLQMYQEYKLWSTLHAMPMLNSICQGSLISDQISLYFLSFHPGIPVPVSPAQFILFTYRLFPQKDEQLISADNQDLNVPANLVYKLGLSRATLKFRSLVLFFFSLENHTWSFIYYSSYS